MSRSRFGFLLTFAGVLVVVVAFFTPWFDVFKLNDPSFYYPRQGYSPWMVLERGQPGSLVAPTVVFALLILAMALSSLALVFTRTTRRRSPVGTITLVVTLLSLVMLIMAIPMIRFDLSFSWPYLNSTPTFGIVLAVAGFAGVLLGLTVQRGSGSPSPAGEGASG